MTLYTAPPGAPSADCDVCGFDTYLRHVVRDRHVPLCSDECERAWPKMQALRADVARLRKLLGMYSGSNDCPLCFASSHLVDQKVKQFGRMQAVSGGHWHVEHSASCDVGSGLSEGVTPKEDP